MKRENFEKAKVLEEQLDRSMACIKHTYAKTVEEARAALASTIMERFTQSKFTYDPEPTSLDAILRGFEKAFERWRAKVNRAQAEFDAAVAAAQDEFDKQFKAL